MRRNFRGVIEVPTQFNECTVAQLQEAMSQRSDHVERLDPVLPGSHFRAPVSRHSDEATRTSRRRRTTMTAWTLSERKKKLVRNRRSLPPE